MTSRLRAPRFLSVLSTAVLTAFRAGMLAALVLSCTEAPAGPAGRATVSMNFLSPATVRLIVVEVTGPGISPAVVANFPVAADSTARGTLDLPAGSGRRFVVSAVDSAGVTTHRADTTLTLQAGVNPALAIRLEPLAAALSMTVTFAGVRLTVLDTTTRSLAPGDSAILSAVAVRPSGDTVPPDSLVWGSPRPAVATVTRGLVRAVREGTVGVTVSFMGAAIPVRVEVGGAPASLDVLQNPSDGTAGAALSAIVVEVKDAEGRRAAGYNGPVRLGFAVNPTNTWVLGDTVVNAVRGIATFTAVSVGLPGSGYRLRASIGALPPDTTAAFSMSDPVVPVQERVIDAQREAYCAVAASGDAYCWGGNTFGGLGTGDLVARSAPTPVVGGHRFRSLALGNGHSCGVTDAAEIYCWGRGPNGQLGNGAAVNSSVPVLVLGGKTWHALDAGTITTCGLTSVGEAYCWGYNNGRLGTGDSIPTQAPVPVAAPVRFTELSVGGFSACASTAGGWTFCWGVNNGRLGNGTRADQLRPVPVSGGHRFKRLSVADLRSPQSALSCGVNFQDETFCWGARTVGQMGDGAFTPDTVVVPVRAMTGIVPRRLATVEGLRTCALDAAGQLYCAGSNAGAFGNGEFESRATPTPAVGTVRFSDIALGTTSTCGISTTALLHCWGLDIPANVPLEPRRVGGSETFAQVAMGIGNHLCARTPAGTAYCWGQNTFGQVGNGNTITPQVTPVAEQGRNTFRTLAVAREASCGVSLPGALLCWGANATEILGRPLGDPTAASIPVAAATSLDFSALAAGNSHMCGIAADARAYCWGANTSGQGGNGTTNSPNRFEPVAGDRQYTQLVAGNAFTCGLSAGGMYCWGSDQVLRAAGAGLTSSTTPVLVSGDQTVASIAAGQNHACFVNVAGEAYCWGTNFNGQVGTGTISSNAIATPTLVTGGITFTSLVGGSGHTCGLATDGSAYCWGSNALGQLGISGTSLVPVASFPAFRFVSLAAGASNTCGITSAGALHCWGTNTEGQLGGASAPLEPAPFGENRAYKVRSPNAP